MKIPKLVLVVLLSCAASYAQGLDRYGGSLDLKCTWPIADYSATITSGNRNNNTVTLTGNFSALALIAKQYVYLTGATPSDFNIAVTPIQTTTVNSTTITYTQNGANESITGGTVVAAHWYKQKIVDATSGSPGRWYFCTPLGNAMTMVGIQNAPNYLGNAQGAGGDYQGVQPGSAALDIKYGTNAFGARGSYFAMYRAVQRLLNWGFNNIYDFATIWTLPTFTDASWGTSDKTMPAHISYVFKNFSPYWNEGSPWLKNYCCIYKQTASGIGADYFFGGLDNFDPNLQGYLTGTLAFENAGDANFLGPNNDYVLGFEMDETDIEGGFRGYVHFNSAAPANGQHWGWQTLVSSPVRTVMTSADTFGGHSISEDLVYPDTQFYSKTELGNWLQGTTNQTTGATASRTASTVTLTNAAFSVTAGYKTSNQYVPQELISISGCSDPSFNTAAGVGAKIISTTVNTLVYTLAGAGTSATGCQVNTGPRYASISALNSAWTAGSGQSGGTPTYTVFGSAASNFTDTVGTGDGVTTSFSHTMAHTPVTPCSVLILINGAPIAGDDCTGPRANPATGGGNFHSTPATMTNNATSWSSGTTVVVGFRIKDSNGKAEIVKIAGTTGGSQPSWPATLGTCTADNTVTWCMVGDSPVTVNSSPITYSTGAGTLVFTTAPANNAAITAQYKTGGWGAGSGILDEDGLSTWVNAVNPFTMTTDNSTIIADNATCASAGICQTSGTSATVTTTGAHGFSSGQTVIIDNVTDGTYQGTYAIQSTPSGTTFTINSTHSVNTHTGTGSVGRPSPMKTDLDNFYFHWVKQAMVAETNAIRINDPGVLYITDAITDQAPVFQAEGPFTDSIFLEPQAQAQNDYRAANAGDVPWNVGLWYVLGQADSYMSVFSPFCCDTGSQAARGTNYASTMSTQLTTAISANCGCGFAGTLPYSEVMGVWTFQDELAAQNNNGLFDERDDPYDGHSASSSAGVDDAGYYTGCQGFDFKASGASISSYSTCEQSCPTVNTCARARVTYGDVIDPVSNANRQWLNNISRVHTSGAVGGTTH